MERSSPAETGRPLLIGISARIHRPSERTRELGGVYTKTLHFVEQSVAQWVLMKDVLPVMIPALDGEELLRRGDSSFASYAEQLDGLVLQGGADVAPESYGESPLDPKWAGDRASDRYELDLFRSFVDAGKPVIGICRGCQLINVAFGGTLFQDIPTQVPSEVVHRDYALYDRTLHDVTLVKGTRLFELYPGITQAKINSIHHQAVKDLGRDLVVEARGVPDGIVEAIRWSGPSYVFGLQWHPEFLAPDSQEDLSDASSKDAQLDSRPILDEFLRAVRDRRGVLIPDP